MAIDRRTVRPIRPIIPGREIDVQLGGVDTDVEYAFDRIRRLASDVSLIGGLASLLFPPTTVAVDTTLNAMHGYVLVDCSGAARTITLPPSGSTTTGRVYIVKKVDTTANAMTIDGDGTDTIDDSATISTTVSETSFMLINHGAGAWGIN
jgi:hypothetical protein